MRFRVWSALIACVFTMLAVASQPTSALSFPLGLPIDVPRLAPGDNDNDGLGDDMDPDDDNDGIQDNEDPAPFDPTIPGAGFVPTPDPDAFDEDTDGDGITNDADPDDNNDGVVDGPAQLPTEVPTAAPTSLPTTVPTVILATIEPTRVPATESPIVQTPIVIPQEPVAEAPVAPVQEAPVVTSLPSTGTGEGSGVIAIVSLLGGMAALFVWAVYWRTSQSR